MYKYSGLRSLLREREQGEPGYIVTFLAGSFESIGRPLYKHPSQTQWFLAGYANERV